MRFASKRDTWLGLVLWGSALIPLAGRFHGPPPDKVRAVWLRPGLSPGLEPVPGGDKAPLP